MQYKLNDANISAETFVKILAIINLVAVVHFFELMYYSIFEHLLATDSKNGGLLGLISTYFHTVETNGQGILHLHCLVWFYGAFPITQLRK